MKLVPQMDIHVKTEKRKGAPASTEQEYILVVCLPAAAVAVSCRGGGCLPGGVSGGGGVCQGVCMPGECLPRRGVSAQGDGGVFQTPPLWTE